MKVLMAVFIITVLTSCFPQARVPVGTILYPYEGAGRPDCLVMFLPGRGDRAADFQREGFIDIFRHTGIKADAVAVDLHFGYYMNKTAAERLRQDVLIPATNRGYRHLWLVGISIGGLAALEYERKYPGDLDGIILLAPYLGGDDIRDEIIGAGGVRSWNPGIVAGPDYERRLWAWVRGYAMQGRHRPVIYLGYGSEDRFAGSDRLLADAIGRDHVMTAPGGHAWSTWKVLWESLVGEIACPSEGSSVR